MNWFVQLRRASVVCLIGVALVATVGAQPSVPAERFVRLEELEELALEKNPTVAQAEAILRSVLGRRRQFGLYPNPLVGTSVEELTAREPGRAKYFVWAQQTFLTGSKRRFALDAVAQEQVHAEAEREMERQRVLNAVRLLYYETLGAARLVEVRRELARLGREAVEVSEQLYNVGQADRPDVLEVEIEAERNELELAKAEHDLARVWQDLATMVGEPELPVSPLAGDLEAELPAVDEHAVRQRVLDRSPELKIARARVEHAKASLARVRAERMPNFFVRGGAGYHAQSFGPGKDVGAEFFVEIGVPLPIFNRNQGNIDSSEAQLKLAEAEVRRVELSLRSRLATSLRNYRDALRTAERYRTAVLARAQQGYQLYLGRFREMAAAYPQVLIAKRTLGQARAEYVRALVDAWQNATLLEGFLLTGGLDMPASVPGEPPLSSDLVPFTVTP